MNFDFCNVCVGSFRKTHHTVAVNPWIQGVKRLLMPFSFEDYRHRRYFSGQKRCHYEGYRHWRYIFWCKSLEQSFEKAVFWGGGVVLPTWTLFLPLALPTQTLQNTDMDVAKNLSITDMDVTKYRHGRYFLRCNSLIINGIRETKEKVNMLYQEKHHHGGRTKNNPWCDDAFLDFELFSEGRGGKCG